MANILSFGQVQSFGMPAEFWVRRAERCREQNMPVRALALLRHAVSLAPDDAEIRLEYAAILRELCCYEASNRACFELLARRPAAFAAFALVAENMLALGNLGEANGAYEIYARYIRLHPEAMPDWDDGMYDVEDALTAVSPGHRYSRQDALFKAIGHRIQRGEWDKAKALLERSRRRPFARPSPQRDALDALYSHGVGRRDRAERLALRAAKAAPRFSGLMLSMAMLLRQLDSPAAGPLLMKAAIQAVSADDERGVCVLAAELKQPWIAESMLRRTLKTAPNRMSALYDLAVFRLRAGDEKSARRMAHQLREIDPEDAYVEVLFTQLEALEAEGASIDRTKEMGFARPFYGAPDPARLADSLQACCNMLIDSVDALADQISKGGKPRRQFLELFALEGNQYRLLPRLLEGMAPKESAALLRCLLLLGTASPQTIRAACDGLKSLGCQPPFLVRADGRLALVDPDAVQPPTPAFMQRMFFRRLKELNALCGPQACAWALGVLRRLPVAERPLLAGDRLHAWVSALQVVWAKERGLPPSALDAALLTPAGRRAFRHACKAVKKAAGRVRG